MNDIVKNIKDCGQSLIDNAEKIAGNLPKYNKRLSFTCYLQKAMDRYINVSYDFIPENFLKED